MQPHRRSRHPGTDSTGGTLTATADDGTVFILEVGPEALLAETEIRMTPLAGLKGMPFGAGPRVVQLEPEGLLFFRPATLIIRPAVELPVDQQILIQYGGPENELTLAAPAEPSAEIRIDVTHFSGYGVTKGVLADIEPVRARLGGDAEARIQNAMAERLARARQNALLGREDNAAVDLVELFNRYEAEVVSNRGGATFVVMALEYITDTRSPSDVAGYVRDFYLRYYPGDTSETFTVTCSGMPSYSAPPSPLWTGIYLVEHQSVETGTFKLYHRPEP